MKNWGKKREMGFVRIDEEREKIRKGWCEREGGNKQVYGESKCGFFCLGLI